MPDISEITASIVADAFVEMSSRTNVGVLGENLPKFDVTTFIKELEVKYDFPFWLAILGNGKYSATSNDKIEITYDVTKANQWRNQATDKKNKKLFVLVLGPIPKLKSLKDLLDRLTEHEIRPIIEKRAISWHATEDRKVFWRYICSQRDYFRTNALLEFMSEIGEVAKTSPGDLSTYEEKSLFKLGLLPYTNLSGKTSPKDLEKAIRSDLALVERIKELSNQDIIKISTILEDESDPNQAIAKAILAFSKTKNKEKLKELEYSEVSKIFAAKKRIDLPEDTPTHPVKKEKELGDEAIIKDIIFNEGKNIDSISQRYDFTNDDGDFAPDEFVVEGRTVIKKYRSGTSQSIAALNLLISDEYFGGLVKVEAAQDYVQCLKSIESGESSSIYKFEPNNAERDRSIISIINTVLIQFGETMGKNAHKAWDDYVTARNTILEYRNDLADHPLSVMANNNFDILNACEILIEAYGTMIAEIFNVCEELRSKDIDVSKALMAKTVALDIIYLDYHDGNIALAAPTHPFHLWRWVEIARMFQKNREEMTQLGEDILLKNVVNPPVFSPHVSLSCYVNPDMIDKDRIYVGLGSLGALPLYGNLEDRIAAKFSAEGIADLASRFIAMAPYAAFGFEVALIDPPGVADLIDALVSINKERTGSNYIPVHIKVFYTRDRVTSTDEEDVELEDLASVIREIKGSLEVEPKNMTFDEINNRLKERPVHYVLIFEPGDSQQFDISMEFSPTLSPLVIPRNYSYQEISDKFVVIIQGDAAPFSPYYQMFRSIYNLPERGTYGRNSGAGRNAAKIQKITKNAMWVSVIDQGIEPTFKVPETIRLDKRSAGGRDVHTFTAQIGTVNRYVKKVIEKAGLIPDDMTQNRIFGLMQRLGGDTIPLAVSSAAKNGQFIEPQAKGLMGVLAVKAWYELYDQDALLISLDTEASRKWILGIQSEEDGRRGDLLCLRQTHEGLQLEVIEVKAHESESSLYSTKGKTTIEGPAIGQIDNTIAILKKILPKSGTGNVDRARREILRDQLYMSIAHRDMTREQRVRAVNMLKEFFDSDSINILGKLFIVHIESQKKPNYSLDPDHKDVKSSQGNAIEVYKILESEISTIEEEPPSSLPEEEEFEVSTAKVEGPTVVAAESEAQSSALSTGLPTQAPVVIGENPLGEGITWDSSKNSNFGILVTGDSGSGKTQTIRALISELRLCGYPITIFDFKPDYADKPFVKHLGLKVYDVVSKGLPFNPMSLMPNEEGIVQPVRHCHDLASIICRVEGLKEQQNHRLVEAMKRAYMNRHIDPMARIPASEIGTEPIFNDVLDELEHDDAPAMTVMYRLSKFRDLALFPTGSVSTSFEKLITDGTVLTLHDEANAKLMQILAEIMIVKLHAIVKKGDQPRVLQRVLVFDEAWRIANSQRLVDLAREGRAFGVGLIVGTQRPKDIPESLFSCLRTQIYLFNTELEDRKIIVRALCNTTAGANAEKYFRAIKNLRQFEGYIISDEYKQGVRVNVKPYYDRV